MPTETTTTAATESTKYDWGGGVSPFNVSYGKLMMWYFLVSDAFSFSGLLIAYGLLRFKAPVWPAPDVVFNSFPFLGHFPMPLVFVSLMTFILIMSSVTMVRAVQEGVQMNQAGVVKWMALTILGGIAFLSCQAWEWTHLITYTTEINGEIVELPTTIFENPWGAVDEHGHHIRNSGPLAFGGVFFTVTGFHGFHVLTGVIINVIMLIWTMDGVFDKRGHYEMIEKVGLYWHFVDLVWVFVFLAFYLL